MVRKFTVIETNYNGYLDPDTCLERFKPWIKFMNEQCLASTTITADADLQVQPLYDYYSTVATP